MDLNENSRFAALPKKLLDWYDVNARVLPWRVGPAARKNGTRPEPYRVWLAEIMLQQTTIPHATRYYLDFLERWPTVGDLAAAKDEDVMAAWAGLGYYARARNLLKCAREVSANGAWPNTATTLQKLPGIGPYTAGAVAALAFDQPAAAVDGNVERVFSRLLAATEPWAQVKTDIKAIVSNLVPDARPAEFAEALMDLGATICSPKSPNCLICPLTNLCKARGEGDPARYPIKPKKQPKPSRRGHVYLLRSDEGHVLTERRPEKGLLGGMLGLPTSEWREESVDPIFPHDADWQMIGQVRHVFTHFSLQLSVWSAQALTDHTMTPVQMARDSLPSVFAKALKLVEKL